jgi:hypothetical protein
MRGILSIAALLVTLLIVFMVVRQQLHTTPPSTPSTSAAPAVLGEVPTKVDPMQAERQVRDGIAAAATAAQRRNDAADK